MSVPGVGDRGYRPAMDEAGDEEAEARLATVVWGTGNMGRAAIRAVLGNPLLSLAAVVAHSPTNVGIDAAEVAGTRPSRPAC